MAYYPSLPGSDAGKFVKICDKYLVSCFASDMMTYPGAPPSVISSQPVAGIAQQV